MRKFLLLLFVFIISASFNAYAEDVEITGAFEFSADFPEITPYEQKSNIMMFAANSAPSDYDQLKQQIEEFAEACTFESKIPYTLDEGESVFIESNGTIIGITETIKNQIALYASNLYLNVLLENPEFMHAATGAGYKYSIYGYTDSYLKCYFELKPTYIITKAELSNALRIADGIVADVIDHNMSAEEKALVLHDYVVKMVEYNSAHQNSGKSANDYTDSDWQNHTAYGALVNKLAVCQGYALSYNLMLNRVGIETKFVSSNEMRHGWSLVKINDNWYHIDTTWADSDGSAIYHNYFLLSDQGIKNAQHTSWDNIPFECTDTTYEAINYCFNGVDVNENAMKYKDGVFYSLRRLYLDDDGYLDSAYGISKSYDDVYTDTVKNRDYAVEYVKCGFDGSNLEIITPREYEAAFAEAYEYDINLFCAENGISMPVTMNNINNSVIFIKKVTETDYNPDVYFVFCDSDGKIIKLNKNSLENANVYYMTNIYPEEAVSSIGIFVWQNGTLEPVAENITVK